MYSLRYIFFFNCTTPTSFQPFLSLFRFIEYMDKAWVELREWIDDIIDIDDDLMEAHRSDRFLLAQTVNFKLHKNGIEENCVIIFILVFCIYILFLSDLLLLL